MRSGIWDGDAQATEAQRHGGMQARRRAHPKGAANQRRWSREHETAFESRVRTTIFGDSLRAAARRDPASSASSTVGLSVSRCLRGLFVVAIAWSAAACAERRTTDPNVITLAVFASPNNFDPRAGTDEVSQKVYQLVFDNLLN